MMERKGWPTMAFMENKCENLPSNCRFPNEMGIKAMFPAAHKQVENIN